MDQNSFSPSLFVSYKAGTPSDGRIPYTREGTLTQAVLKRLSQQIDAGWVRSVQMDGAAETSLKADLRNGWATVYIVREGRHYFELLNEQSPDRETPLDITADGPTPKKHATEDFALIGRIIVCFAQTGEPYHGCAWEHTLH